MVMRRRRRSLNRRQRRQEARRPHKVTGTGRPGVQWWLIAVILFIAVIVALTRTVG